MKTRKTKTSKTEAADGKDTIHRVWRLTPAARQAIAAMRGSRHCETNQATIDVAIGNFIEPLTNSLLKLGFSALVEKQETYRLPMSDSSLAALKEASEKTGVPASHLFLLCVSALEAPKARKTKKGA